MQERFELEFPLYLGNAEETDFADASFDLVVSEYGASIWCNPYHWISEAARLLRPGGNLAFLINSVLLILCTPVDADAETPARSVWSDRTSGCIASSGPTGRSTFTSVTGTGSVCCGRTVSRSTISLISSRPLGRLRHFRS
jgi:SAM-dependent methyltransferase